MSGLTPVERFVSRLTGVLGKPQKCRATCPACHRRGALSVAEGRDKRALGRCFAGCELAEIVRAVSLTEQDLFDDRDSQRQRDRERFEARRRFTKSPSRTLRDELDKELDALRTLLRTELGYDRPIRSSDINGVRERVSRRLQLEPALPPIAPFVWECAPFDDDPNWPPLYMRALEEEVRRRWHAIYPEARPWETDPDGAGFYDRIRAEKLAREWQRAMAA